MPNGFLEHANITVSDPDRSATLLQSLCGWHERWRGQSQLGGWTIHVGNERDYIAVYTKDKHVTQRFTKGAPLNHIGLVVDDLDAAEIVVAQAGLTPFSHADYEPGGRFYFLDWDGIEFEIVSYPTPAPARSFFGILSDALSGGQWRETATFVGTAPSQPVRSSSRPGLDPADTGRMNFGVLRHA